MPWRIPPTHARNGVLRVVVVVPFVLFGCDEVFEYLDQLVDGAFDVGTKCQFESWCARLCLHRSFLSCRGLPPAAFCLGHAIPAMSSSRSARSCSRWR